jgi:DNA-binding transcriptional MerR regulator
VKDFSKERLLNLANEIIEKDDQVKIATLSDELTISQVVKFFEKQGRSFTKTMIQNYVRVGVLPPPIDKRYYTKNHLIMLTLIDNLKNIYSLDEIKTVLEPIRNNPDIFEDDIIDTSNVYKNYLTMRKEAFNKWKESLPHLIDKVDDLLQENSVKDNDKDKAMAFMIALTIMAETIALKDMTGSIIREYIKQG